MICWAQVTFTNISCNQFQLDMIFLSCPLRLLSFSLNICIILSISGRLKAFWGLFWFVWGHIYMFIVTFLVFREALLRLNKQNQHWGCLVMCRHLPCWIEVIENKQWQGMLKCKYCCCCRCWLYVLHSREWKPCYTSLHIQLLQLKRSSYLRHI